MPDPWSHEETVERAKAEAQKAKESEAAIKTKPADADAARAKAEQACHIGDTTRSGASAAAPVL